MILSIENHCTVPQQKRMAQCLTEVLQDKLDLSNVNVHETKKLPSPESLKGKVLVKVMSSVDLKKNLRRKNEHKQKNVWGFFFFRERNFLRIWTLMQRKETCLMKTVVTKRRAAMTMTHRPVKHGRMERWMDEWLVGWLTVACRLFQDGNVNSVSQTKKKRRFTRSIMRSFDRKV